MPKSASASASADFATVAVAAVQDSRRRIGRGFGKTLSDPFAVSEAELEQLHNDPMLVVVKIDGKPPAVYDNKA